MTDLIPDISRTRATRGTPETRRAGSVPTEGFGEALNGAIGDHSEGASHEALDRDGSTGQRPATGDLAPATPSGSTTRSEPSALSLAAQAAFARLTERGVWHRALGVGAEAEREVAEGALGAVIGAPSSDAAESSAATVASDTTDTIQSTDGTDSTAGESGAAMPSTDAAAGAATIAGTATAPAAGQGGVLDAALAAAATSAANAAVTAAAHAGQDAAGSNRSTASTASSAAAVRASAAPAAAPASPSTPVQAPSGEAAPSASAQVTPGAASATETVEARVAPETAGQRGNASAPVLSAAQGQAQAAAAQAGTAQQAAQAGRSSAEAVVDASAQGAATGAPLSTQNAPAAGTQQPIAAAQSMSTPPQAAPAQGTAPQAAPAPSQSAPETTPGAPLPAGVTRLDSSASMPTAAAPVSAPIAAPTGVPASAFAPLDPATRLSSTGVPTGRVPTASPMAGVPTAGDSTGDVFTPGLPGVGFPVGGDPAPAEAGADVDAAPAAHQPFSDEVRQAAARTLGDGATTEVSTAQDAAAVEGSSEDVAADPTASASQADGAEGDEASAQSRSGDGGGEQRGDQRSDNAPAAPREGARTDFVPLGGDRGFNASAPVGAAAAAAPSGPAPAAAPLQAQILAGIDRVLRRGDGLHQIELQLAPAHLGKVRITLELRGGEVSVMMRAADGTARDLLKSNIDDLRSQLGQMGLSAGSVDVDSGGHADGNDGWQQLVDSQTQARRAAQRGDGTGFPGDAAGATAGDYRSALTTPAFAASAPADRSTSPTTPATDPPDDLDVLL